MAIKKPKEEAVVIMQAELKSMIPTYLICNGIVLLICVIYSIVTSTFNWRILTGLLIGNITAVSNFIFLGYKAASIVRRKNSRYARTALRTGFLLRYFAAFAVFGALLHFNVINVLAAVLPLFYPKIHYTIRSIFFKGEI